MKRRFPILSFVLAVLLSSEATAQTQQTPLTVTVVGAAAKPGIYQMNSGLTLVTLVAMSGGLHPRADSSMIQVVRLKEQAADSNLIDSRLLTLRSPVVLFPQPFQHASEIVAFEAGAQGRAALLAIEDVGVFGKT